MSRLLSESYLSSLPDPIAENMQALNDYVVKRLCERIGKIGKVSPSDAHRLKSAIEYAGTDLQAIQKELARTMGLNEKDLEAMFEDVAKENVDFANIYYKARGMQAVGSYAENAALNAFVEAAKATAAVGVINISNTTMIGFKSGKRIIPLREYYIQTVDRAITFAQTGTVDYYTAMRSTIKEMARSGLRRVTFDSGYSRRLDSQARMNLLEGVRRLNSQMMEQTGREFGADGVEISAHALCAPDHQHIQGRQYSLAEFERINSRLKRPIGTLNCHHFTTPIILGVSKPVYSRSELAEINRRSNQKITYQTTDRKGNTVTKTMSRYDASQRQRRLETAIRYAKDERDACVAAGDKLGATQARKKSAALTAEYKRFSEQAGLTVRLERTRSMKGRAG